MTLFVALLPMLGSFQIQEQPPADKKEEDLLKLVWTMPGHLLTSNSDMLLAATADGKWLVSAGEVDSTIKVWSLADNKLERTILVRPKQNIHFVDVSRDSTKIVAGGPRYSAVYDLKTGARLNQYIHRSTYGMTFVLGDEMIYNVDLHQVFFAKNGIPNSDVVKPDGRFCNFTAKMLSFDRTRAATFAGPVRGPMKAYLLQWFDLISGFSLYRLQMVPEDYLNDPIDGFETVNLPSLIAGPCTPSNDLILVDLRDSKLYVAPSSGDIIYLKYDGRKDPEGNRVVGPGYKIAPQGNLCMLRSNDGSKSALFRVPELTPASRCLTSMMGSSKSSWALGVERVFVMSGHVYGLAPSLIERGLDNSIAHNFNLNGSPVSGIAVRKSDGLVAAAFNEGVVRLYSSSGDLLRLFPAPEIFQPSQMLRSITSRATLSDLFVNDQYIVGVSGGPFMFVFDLNGNLVKKHNLDPDSGWGDRPHSIPVANGDTVLVSTRVGKKGVRLLDTLTGELKRQYEPTGAVSYMAATNKDVVAIIGDQIDIWDIETGALKTQIKSPAGNITAMAANEQLSRFVLGTADGRIFVLSLKDGKLLKHFEASACGIIALTCTRDNRLITRSTDEDPYPLKYWDLASCEFQKQYGNEVAPCSLDQNCGSEVIATNRGGKIIFGRDDGTIVVATAD